MTLREACREGAAQLRKAGVPEAELDAWYLLEYVTGISRASLWKVESGNPACAMGIYAAVLHALNNMDKDLLLVAKDDEMGRKLQDMNLMTRKRASGRRK